MAITTPQPPPEIAQDQPRRPSRLRWLLLALVIAGLALLFYSPALTANNHDPQSGNLFANLTGKAVFPADSTFYSAWNEASEQLRDFKIPLWQSRSFQPLLEATGAPILYPGAIFYYSDFFVEGWGKILFALAHLWWLGLGLAGLAGFSKGPFRTRSALAAVGVLVAMLVAATLPLDWLAAFSWLPPALLLAKWRRRFIALIALPLPLAMMALAGPLPLVLLLYALTMVWWLGRSYLSRPVENLPGLRRYTRLSAFLVLAMLGGVFIAGPQLFPRLTYSGPAYNPALPAFEPATPVTAKGATVKSFERQNNGQILIGLSVPANTAQFELNLQGHSSNGNSADLKATGWGGQVWPGGPDDETKKGPEVKVSGPNGPSGDQLATVKFGEKDLPTGLTEYTMRLRYGPLSFTMGLYAAFMGLVSLALLLVSVGWVRFYREDENDHPLRRVVKNSATPLFAQLTGKVIDFANAILILRLLGPEGNGEYAFAVTTWLFFSTICDFGLESIVTREVARARTQPDSEKQINRLFVTKLAVRFAFSVTALPVSLLWIGGFSLTGNLTTGSAWAIILLMIGFWPTAVAGSITAVFRGYEKFEYLAAGQMLASVIKVPLGLGALLVGWGVIGLAASSVVVNFIQVALLQALMRSQLFTPRLNRQAFDRSLARQLIVMSFPLMINGLIVNILFKSDSIFLQAFRGNTELGVYNSAYKFIDALLIIPSTLTMALFPLFSVYGAEAKDNMLRAYREGLRLLMVIALPISFGTLFVAHDLIGALGGPEFLPDGAIALQILIWFLPFSYLNGLTQYVLIAINKQRSITWAVILAAISNVALNLLLIPFFGFVASAALTIVTELVLLVPFCLIMRRALGPGSVPLLETTWRPTVAAGVMGLALYGLSLLGINHFVVTVVAGGAIYLAGLVLTRAVTGADLALFKRVIRRKA
ncbi:MAG TPA: flippase [Chloroflexia bacterium]|nr:flippase [Chloroflexia bacterium]